MTLNGGDGAIMVAIRDHVRRALGSDAELLVCDVQARTARELYPDATFALPVSAFAPRGKRVRYIGQGLRKLDAWRWLAAARLQRFAPGLARRLLRRAEYRILQQYAGADLAISTGGTYLVENYDLSGRIFEFRFILALGLPLVLYTQSMGPFRKRSHRRAFRRIFKSARAVMLRDEPSLTHVREIGVPDNNLSVLADVVFTFAQTDRNPDFAPTPGRVVISVREWDHYSRADGSAQYEEAIRRLAVHLVREHGSRITFLSTCQGVPSYWTDDSRYACEIVAALPEDVKSCIIVDRTFSSPQALLARLGEFDAIVATRMHLAILGLCAGTPVLPISYEFKTAALFSRLGMAEYTCDVDGIDGDDLVASFDRFWACRRMWAPSLREGVERERRLADQALKVLRAAA